jgi:hypothetical protein
MTSTQTELSGIALPNQIKYMCNFWRRGYANSSKRSPATKVNILSTGTNRKHPVSQVSLPGCRKAGWHRLRRRVCRGPRAESRAYLTASPAKRQARDRRHHRIASISLRLMTLRSATAPPGIQTSFDV